MAGLNNHDDGEFDRQLNQINYQDFGDEKKYGNEDPDIQEGNSLNSIKGSLESVQDYTSSFEVSQKNSIKSRNAKGDNNENVNLNIENNSQESSNIRQENSATSIKHELNPRVSQESRESVEIKIANNKKTSSSGEIAFKNSNILPQDQQQSAGEMNIQQSWQSTQELNPELSRKKSERTKNSRELDVALTNPNTLETSSGNFINKGSNESVKISNYEADKIVKEKSEKMMSKESQLGNPNTSTGSAQDKQLNNVKEAAQTASELNSRNTNKGCVCCGSVLCVGAKKISAKDQPLFKRKLKHHCFRSIPSSCWGLVPNCPKITGLTSLTEDCECSDDIDQREVEEEEEGKDQEPTPITCSGPCANLDRLRRLKRDTIEGKLAKAKDKPGGQEDPFSKADDSDESESSLLSDDFLDCWIRFGELMTIEERARQLEVFKCCGPNCCKTLLVSTVRASKTDGEQQERAIDDEEHGQLKEKTLENQQLAGKVCELEGQVRSLKSQLQQCNEQQADLTVKQREVGASKLADVVGKDIERGGEEVLGFRDKEIIAKPIILDAAAESYLDRKDKRTIGSQSILPTSLVSSSKNLSRTHVSNKRSSGGSDEDPIIEKTSYKESLRADESQAMQFDVNLSNLERAHTQDSRNVTDEHVTFDKDSTRIGISKLDETGENGAPGTRVSVDSQVNQSEESNLMGYGDIYDEMSLREFREVSKLEDSDIERYGDGSLKKEEERKKKPSARNTRVSDDSQSNLAGYGDPYAEMSVSKFKEVSKLEDSDTERSGNGSLKTAEKRTKKLSAKRTQEVSEDDQVNQSNLDEYEESYDQMSLRELKEVSKLEDTDVEWSGIGSLKRLEESHDKLAAREPRVSEDSQANESDLVGYKDIYDEMSFREFREVSEIVDSDIERLENEGRRKAGEDEDKLTTRLRADAGVVELNQQELEQWLKNILDVFLVIRICQMCSARKGQLMSVCEAICYKLGIKLPNDDEKEVNEKTKRSERREKREDRRTANEFKMEKLIKYQIQDARASTKSAVDSVIEKEIPAIGNSSRGLLTDQIEPTHSIRTHSLIKKASELAKLQLSEKPIDSAIGTSTFGREEPRDIHSIVSAPREFIDSIPEGSFSYSPIGTSTPKKKATEEIRSKSPEISQNLSQFGPTEPPLLSSPTDALKKIATSDKNSSSSRMPVKILEVTQTTAVDKSIVNGGGNFETRIDINESVGIPRVSNARSEDLKISSDPSYHPEQMNSGAGRIIITEDTPYVEGSSIAAEASREIAKGEGKAARGYENARGIKRMERIFFQKSSDSLNKSGTKMNSMEALRNKNVGEHVKRKIDETNRVEMQGIKIKKNGDEKVKGKGRMEQNGSQTGKRGDALLPSKKNPTTRYKEPIVSSQSTSNSREITKSSSIIPKFPCCICRAIKMTRDQYEKTLAAESGSDCLAESSRIRDYQAPDSYYQKDKQMQAKNATIRSFTSAETQTHCRQRRIAPKYLPDFSCNPCDCDPCGSKSLNTESSGEDQVKSRKNVSPRPGNKRNQAVLAKIHLSKR